MCELKNCKCGNKPIYLEINDAYGNIYYRVFCRKCKSFANAASKKRVIEKWNNSVDLPQPPKGE